MKYKDLRDFIGRLEEAGELRRVRQPVSPVLEMTELCDRVLRAGGPALLFDSPPGYGLPVLGNLFGTTRRIALGMGIDDAAAASEHAALESLRDVGRLLSALKEPEPPKGLRDAGKLFSLAKAVWDMAPKVVSAPPCQEVVLEGDDVDLAQLPIQTCWPGDAAPLITWGLTVTRGPNKRRQNLGIYRQQLIGRNKLIMRWLAHRGGALDFREFALKNPGKPYPVAVVLGADPATILGAVTPVPDTLSEYQFAGLLRGGRTELAKCLTPGVDTLQVPARAEIVLEGFIHPQSGEPAAAPRGAPRRPSQGAAAGYEHALEGPYGDHTGYYNEQEWFPVFTVERITMRRDAHLSFDLHRQAARRTGDARRRAERGLRAAAAKAVSGDHRFLSAARGMQLPDGNRTDEEELRGPREARHVWCLELPAAVHVHEVHRRRR